ncbi:MAG TPA: hypothetical protein VIF14_13620 [Alphaproteobacteria bacterium]|jgi:hypothetical protein
MPHRNRVDPFGALIETPARGAWYGNRGCLHDRDGRITGRKPPTDAWIICLLEFKNRRRKLLQPGRFTELFFLDEATGFAAGHRPCGECRHADLRRFGAAWPGTWPRGFALACEIDEVLKWERADPADNLRVRWIDPRRPPPDGWMFVRMNEDPLTAVLAAGGKLWRWTPFGYQGPLPWTRRNQVMLLTPPSTADAIENGYRVQIHPSALR